MALVKSSGKVRENMQMKVARRAVKKTYEETLKLLFYKQNLQTSRHFCLVQAKVVTGGRMQQAAGSCSVMPPFALVIPMELPQCN